MAFKNLLTNVKGSFEIKKNRKRDIYQMWTVVFIISLIGLLLMIVSTLTQPTHRTLSTGALAPSWKEHLILFFYFTFISNLLGFVSSSLSSSKVLKVDHSITKTLKILTTTCLVITLVVYWTILGPGLLSKLNAFEIFSNIFIHLLTPLLFFMAFTSEAKKFNFNKKISIKKTIIINFWFPVVWLIVASIIYYSLGSEHEDAIYGFLAFQQNAWWLSFLYCFGIGIAFILFTWLFSYIQNINVSK